MQSADLQMLLAASGISQGELSRRIDRDVSTISLYKSGARPIPTHVAQNIVSAIDQFGVEQNKKRALQMLFDAFVPTLPRNENREKRRSRRNGRAKGMLPDN